MKFSYNWLQSFFKKKLPNPKKLAELLTLHFAEVEEIKEKGGDFILEIDIRPNRAGDCFSHIGIAREISAITNLIFYNEKIKLLEDKKLKSKDFIKIEIKNKKACLRYTARVIHDLKIEPSPKWIQEKLEACGLKPINNVVDIANYVMLETGQPLHIFDGEKIENKKIIVRFAKKDEKIITLDEEKYVLDDDILIIADEKKPLAIAGIKGGKGAEVNEKTKIIIIEAANFNSQTIRQGSKKIDLKTDASWRFENGIDSNLTELAINKAAYLIQEIAKGKIFAGLIDFYPQKVLPRKIKLDLNYLGKLLGKEVSKNEIIKILKKLEFKIINIQNKQLLIEIPSFRLDISIQEDLIEEIGRIYGLEKIPSIFPIIPLTLPEKNLNIIWENKIKDILKEIGFNEVYNYSFISEKEVEIFKYDNKNLIELRNPISSNFQYLRPSLIPNLLKNAEKNQLNFEEIKIFELGKTFKFQKGKIEERKTLSGLITGDSFYEIKGAIDLLLKGLGINSLYKEEWCQEVEKEKKAYNKNEAIFQELEISILRFEKCAEIKINNEKIGFLGEISQEILNALKIGKKVSLFNFDFEKLIKLASEEIIYQPISRFPFAIRDIAILVPEEIKIKEVLDLIKSSKDKILKDVNLFDIYQGKELPEGKKNLAFHLVFQAEDRTLNSKEIDEIKNKIIKILETMPQWQVRK